MKKIFCDVCGNEMDYPGGSNQPIQHLFGKDSEISVVGQGNKPYHFKLHVKLDVDGTHVDVCADCRLFLLNKLDPRTVEEQIKAIQ